MMDDDKQVNETDAEVSAAEEAEATTEAEAAPAEGGDLQAEVERLAQENAELKERMMRALAEAENVRRRAEKERGDMAKFGVSPLAKELMPVADNLRRALDSLPTDQIEADEQLKNFVLGIEMTEKQLQDAFTRVQIEKVDPKGEPFSYKLHQAMTELENTGQPAGTVVEVLQAGYVLHERLLRPAMVVVAKGEAEEKPGDVDHIDTTA